jgi:hypothetical protein
LSSLQQNPFFSFELYTSTLVDAWFWRKPICECLGDFASTEVGCAVKLPASQLREKGFVLDNGKRRCTATGEMAHAWIAKHPVLPPVFPIFHDKLGIFSRWFLEHDLVLRFNE